MSLEVFGKDDRVYVLPDDADYEARPALIREVIDDSRLLVSYVVLQGSVYKTEDKTYIALLEDLVHRTNKL